MVKQATNILHHRFNVIVKTNQKSWKLDILQGKISQMDKDKYRCWCEAASFSTPTVSTRLIVLNNCYAQCDSGSDRSGNRQVFGFELQTSSKTYKFAAIDFNEYSSWIQAFQVTTVIFWYWQKVLDDVKPPKSPSAKGK